MYYKITSVQLDDGQRQGERQQRQQAADTGVVWNYLDDFIASALWRSQAGEEEAEAETDGREEAADAAAEADDEGGAEAMSTGGGEARSGGGKKRAKRVGHRTRTIRAKQRLQQQEPSGSG